MHALLTPLLARIRHQGHCQGQISVLGGVGGQIRCVAATGETGICDLGAVTSLVLLGRDAIREFGACHGTPRSEAVRGGRRVPVSEALRGCGA